MGDVFLLSPVAAGMILLVVPLVGFFVAPERTVVEVQRFRAWLTRSGAEDGGRRRGPKSHGSDDAQACRR
jgi:hypothetical protein